MSGHSRWAGIKHKKAVVDAKRGKVFTRLGREITVAAREGGGNPDNNARLRKAIDDAREANMPQENVKRAVQRGTGEIPGVNFEEIRYEGFGPGGAAVLVDVTTDNKNRTAPEIRKIFTDHGGSLGEQGAVGWMFSLKGLITVEKNKVDEESLLSLALESGAEDMKSVDEEVFEVTTSPADFEKVRAALAAKNISVADAQVTQVAQTSIPLSGAAAESVLALVQELEEHEDVKAVYSNFDVPKELLNKVLSG